jgi:intracellular septation protein A
MFWWEYLKRALAEDLALNNDLWIKINPEVISYFSGSILLALMSSERFSTQ